MEIKHYTFNNQRVKEETEKDIIKCFETQKHNPSNIIGNNNNNKKPTKKTIISINTNNLKRGKASNNLILHPKE